MMANSLLDFLQSASNTAADTVAAPVDLLAMALRKAGVPITNPVGGTQWMTERGLRRDVKQSPASLAGETMGLLSPVVAAAKAPQIARGLLQHAEDFQKYNRALGPAGASQAIVWHGSPHKFDRFDSSKIGSGEGAQAYGHGVYFAEAKDVAQTYQPRDPKLEQRLMQRYSAAERAQQYPAMQVYEDFLLHKTPDEVAANVAASGYSAGDLRAAEAALKLATKEYHNQRTGSLYKVDLPDNMIARMLDWDKPLSQQPGLPMDVFGLAQRNSIRTLPSSSAPLSISPAIAQDMASNKTGSTAYQMLVDTHGPNGAAMVLRRSGVPGIRYLDGGSRGANAGTSNFVVFPGEENALRILERNGLLAP